MFSSASYGEDLCRSDIAGRGRIEGKLYAGGGIEREDQHTESYFLLALFWSPLVVIDVPRSRPGPALSEYP